MIKSLLIAVSIASSLTLFTSCGGGTKKDYSKEVDEGKFNGNSYHSDKLNWTMEFPSNWQITSKSSLVSMDERSKMATGDTTSDMSGIKRLLAFQKNYENNFQSTMEDFSGKSKETYYSIIHQNHEKIYNNYLDQRSGIDTASMVVTIDGQEFDMFELKLFTRKGVNFASQILFNALINEQFVTVAIAYDNLEDREKMIGLFMKSKFK
jgi:hypothetical protein